MARAVAVSTRGHGVDRDVVDRKLDCQLSREPDHRGLGGSVSHPSRTGAYAADGRDVDHPASTALLHQRNGVLRRQQGSCEVDRDCRVPPFELYLGQRRGAGDSALFTRTSHRSSSSVSHANSAATDSAADTSTCLANAFPPLAEISVATASARLRSRSAMTTVNPSADSRRPIASPIPAGPPVTTATAESPTGIAANGRLLSAATSFMVASP